MTSPKKPGCSVPVDVPCSQTAGRNPDVPPLIPNGYQKTALQKTVWNLVFMVVTKQITARNRYADRACLADWAIWLQRVSHKYRPNPPIEPLSDCRSRTKKSPATRATGSTVGRGSEQQNQRIDVSGILASESNRSRARFHMSVSDDHAKYAVFFKRQRPYVPNSPKGQILTRSA